MAKFKMTELMNVIYLALFGEKDGVAAKDVIETYGVSKATFYRIIKKMIELGHASEKHNLYKLTEAGEKIIKDRRPKR